MSKKEKMNKSQTVLEEQKKEHAFQAEDENENITANNSEIDDKNDRTMSEIENQTVTELNSEVIPEEKNESPVDEKDEKIKELQDKYLRLVAEFDNYRKRTMREKMELLKYASEEILKDLLPVIDDIDRAMAHINEASDIEALKKGMELINNKFNEFLKQKGIKEIEAYQKEFNADLHEAISKMPVDDESLKGKNIAVVQKGYFLNDKIIRHSKVVVGE
jgi:molecular chaperone GrpE